MSGADRSPHVVAVASGREAAAELHAALIRSNAPPRVVSCTATEALARSPSLMARLRGGCLVLGADVPAAASAQLASDAAQTGVKVVTATDLSRLDGSSTAVRASARVLDPAVIALVREVHGGRHGRLLRLSVRSPAGRRQPPPASARTPFRDGARVHVDLSPDERSRVARMGREAFLFVDCLLPGASEALEVTELVAAPSGDRLVAHARVGDLSIDVELDDEMKGEGPIEIEAKLEKGSLICRFATTGASLARTAVLQSSQVDLTGQPSALALAVRHALSLAPSGPPSPASQSGEIASEERVGRAIDRYRVRVKDRPIDMVLVHVPRFRNLLDELELPSLAAARLAAFTRGHGWRTRVVDLQITHALDPLECFANDGAVDGWLRGEPEPVVDAAVERLWATLGETLLEAKAGGRRCLVGLSIVDYFGHFQMNIAACLARKVKQSTGFPTVLGGERDQVDGDRALAMTDTFDYVVDGDGEVPLLGLLHLEAYGDRRATAIPGVWSRDGAAVHKNKLLRSHLNAMPRPDFDDVDRRRYLGGPPEGMLAKMRRDGVLGDEAVEPFCYFPYAFVKGCTAKCEFCSAKEWLDVQSPEKSVDDLLFIAQKYGVRDFMFLNNLVNVGPRLLERFCRRLIDSKAGLQWTDSCRPTGISGELAALMRESGCLLLNYGAESGSDKILALMKKGLTARDIVETLRNTHNAGIINRVNFIAGYFHETPEDVDATIDLVQTLADEIDIIGCFQGFYLFPGMGVDAAKAGVVLRPGLDSLKSGQTTLGYDEIGGLTWEVKRDTIDASRTRILASMEAVGIRTFDKINEYALFWLSRRFDKATVTRYLLGVPSPESLEGRVNQASLPPGGQRGRVAPLG